MNVSRFPIVSIITVNYNQTNVTRALLKSLRRITYPNIEIILVDNGSEDRSYKSLEKEYPEITLLESGENLGFSGGNNFGIQAAIGELLLLINNDVEVTPGFLEPLVGIFDENPEAGMVSPKIVYYNSGERIQYAGSEGINPWTGRGKKTGYLEKDNGQYSHPAETALVHGACVMVSRKLIEKVGTLHEKYFMYYEEHDWAERAKRHGFKMYYAGNSKVYHKASATAGNDSPMKTYYMTRNRLMYLRRNVPFPEIIMAMLVFLCMTAPKHMLLYLLRSDFANLSAFVRGVLWHVGIKSSHANRKPLLQGVPRFHTSHSIE